MKEYKRAYKWKSQQHVPTIDQYLTTHEDLQPGKIIHNNARHKTMQATTIHSKSDEIQPFRIKDFIPIISPQVKSELIKNNKNNFLDFLFVQKIGRSGDQKFFDSLLTQYNFDPYKKSLIPKDQEDPKCKISYLQKRDEKNANIEKLVHQVFNMKKKELLCPNDAPLDKLIIEKNQFMLQRLPKCRIKLESLKQKQL